MKKVREASEILTRRDQCDNPTWWDGKQLDEIEFCAWFRNKHDLIYVGSKFYDIDGMVSDKWKMYMMSKRIQKLYANSDD